MKVIAKIVLLCLAMLSACTNKEEPVDESSGNQLGNDGIYTIQLPTSTEEGKKTWLPGDQLVVHGESNKDQLTITLTAEDISADGRTCSINVSGVTPYEQKATKTVYYVAYPGELVQNDKNCKDKSKFSATNALLLAGYNKGNTFIVESLVGGFTFTVNGEYDSYSLTGNNAEIVGYSTLTCRITENTKIYAYAMGDALTTITGTVASDGTTVNHVCIPGNLNLPDGIQMTLYNKGKPVKTYYTEVAYDMKRDAFISLGDITSKLTEYKTPEANNHVSAIPVAGAVDLGIEETANCYLVNGPGTYAFKAVKGNSTEPLASIGSVEVLWESWGTTEDVTPNSVVAQVDFEKDMIYFRVAEDYHSGNAVVAARNDMGAIIWSWHIWAPKTPVTEGLYNLSRRMSHDRNLGALVAASSAGASPESAGLFYQWGRKDPFVGVGDFSTGEPASVAGEVMTLFGGQMTTAKSIKNPTAFANILDEHWNPSTADEYWAQTKTKYDPCPPGYKVPYRSEYLPFTDSPLSLAGWMYDEDNNVLAVGNPATTYPLGGYITTEGVYNQYGEGTRVWSSRSHSTASNAYNFRIFESNGEPSWGNGGKPKSNAFAVRCVRHDVTPFENSPETPVKGNYTKYEVNMQELSGLYPDIDGQFLWGVGDQGVLAKIGFDGSMEKVKGQSLDMESVTLNPETGDLYLGCEANHVYKAFAPDYKKIEHIFSLDEAADYGNSGVEGISWYKDRMMLVGTQTGAYMWAYRFDGTDADGKEVWTKVWKKSMRTIAIGMQEIADIYYDAVKDQIWIIDSETQSIYLFDGDATEHLATYRGLSFAGNCESVCVDYNNDCVWIADDDDPSKLFKIDFTF